MKKIKILFLIFFILLIWMIPDIVNDRFSAKIRYIKQKFFLTPIDVHNDGWEKIIETNNNNYIIARMKDNTILFEKINNNGQTLIKWKKDINNFFFPFIEINLIKTKNDKYVINLKKIKEFVNEEEVKKMKEEEKNMHLGLIGRALFEEDQKKKLKSCRVYTININEYGNILSKTNRFFKYCDFNNANIDNTNKKDKGYIKIKLSSNILVIINTKLQLITAYNSQNEILWQYNILDDLSNIKSYIKLKDNAVAIGGKVPPDTLYYKLDSDGFIEIYSNKGKCSKTVGGDDNDFITNLIPINNENNIIAIGYTSSFGKGKRNIWIINFDTNCNIKWQKTIGKKGYNTVIKQALKTNDGNFIIYGEEWTDTLDKEFIYKINKKGNIIWKHYLSY